ncbi:MAG: hypothetical protein ACI83O_000777 [Patescibacteria group bacterium]|jgi:hypothetical protein
MKENSTKISYKAIAARVALKSILLGIMLGLIFFTALQNEKLANN